jgi:hypothetical protein
MAVTRIKNNQITDSTIVANAKVVDYSISASKLANNLTYGSDFTISGNLTVNGTTTTIDTINTLIEDPILVLADGQTSGSPVVDIGILGYRGTENSSFIGWKESASTFMAILSNTTVSNTTVNVTSYANFTASTITAQANLSVIGNIVGNANFSGNLAAGNILTPGIVSATANITGGNILTVGLISATGNITTAGALNGATLSLSGNVTSPLNVTGNITSGNILTPGLISATSTITSAANITGGNVLTGGLISATGNITGGNVTTGGIISSGGNIITGTNGALGIGTAAPDCEVNILANPQTVSYSITGSSTTLGTDLHISGANGSQTRIVQDAFGTGSYVAFTGRTAGGTAATPTQTLSADTLTQFTARGFSNGSLQFGNASTGRVDIVAAENFTDTSRATNVTVFTTATGAITPTAIATFSSASGLSVAGNVTLGNVVNGGANGAGNIGSATTYFNTIFGKATTAQYADLAELYSADAEYTPGTVLDFGGNHEVTLSNTSSSTRIAGVVSTNPAHLMNSVLESQYAVAVALTGRVPTRVVGTVRKGDMMVSAGNGHAQACAVPAMGTVIGKALENFDGVSGTIEIVVGRL